ncbi:glycoside hydrolase 43 family protein [Labilibaculum sp. K2S]|uniref:glycoside hydrolase family 43 protein n=1 Tax=Labilibaculum sp. K2S TaxID=3056386 RepID=UPI0025A4517E|nr:glycoside hydrolase 43 family protein [Labilibaculum sp. K2S]MDM8159323.1 glycoside hydrolase 43 family protein [Labilibaculum sp. K2S]
MKIFFIDHRLGLILISLLMIASLPGCNHHQKPSSKNEFTNKSNYVSKVWKSDNEDGTYTNPIIHADYSDPDVIRVGDDYFMTASSFNSSPALPILHSKDLVNWQIVNHALKRLSPNEFFNIPQHGKGVWAPCIRFHNNEYYIYWGDPDHGVFMVKTTNPFNEWEAPVLVMKGKGIIDPSPLWDSDGKMYMATAWAGSRSGINSVLTIWPLKNDGTEVIGEGKHIFDGHDHHHTIEGPKLYKKGDYYYIFAPAGGVTNGWQTVLRSKNIYGPYEEKIVMAQGTSSTNGPHQGAWVETQTGESWFLHFQDKGVYGRIIHLQPVNWINDWPVIGIDKDNDGCGEPVTVFKKPNVGKTWPVCSPQEDDEFNSDTLGLQWQWAANSNLKWSVLIRNQGYLRLLAYPKTEVNQRLWDVPNLLLQKFPAPSFKATTKVKLTLEWEIWQGKKAGLMISGNDYSYLSISKDETGYLISQVVCLDANNGGVEKTIVSARLTKNEVFLRVNVSGPDAECNFSYSEDGENYFPIGITHKAKPELWIGAKVGLFCTAEPGFRMGGYADFDWFVIN